MARFAPFLTMKHTLLFLLAGFFLYLICNSLHNIREGATVGSAPKNFLNAGDQLLINDYIASTDKQFFLIMQSDGNLVIYKGSGPSDNSGVAVWSSKTSGSTGQTFTQMQRDGNLVIYKGTPEEPKAPLWSTNTGGKASGDYVAVLGDAGIIKLFQGTDQTHQDGSDYWSSDEQDYILKFHAAGRPDYAPNTLIFSANGKKFFTLENPGGWEHHTIPFTSSAKNLTIKAQGTDDGGGDRSTAVQFVGLYNKQVPDHNLMLNPHFSQPNIQDNWYTYDFDITDWKGNAVHIRNSWAWDYHMPYPDGDQAISIQDGQYIEQVISQTLLTDVKRKIESMKIGQQLDNEVNEYKDDRNDMTSLTGKLNTTTTDFNNDQTDITSLTGKLNTMTTDYNSDQSENTALTNKVNTQSQKIISTMDTNVELSKNLKAQQSANAALNAKLKAKGLEMAVFEKHIEKLQNASFENKVNTELNGSVTYPKNILHR